MPINRYRFNIEFLNAENKSKLQSKKYKYHVLSWTQRIAWSDTVRCIPHNKMNLGNSGQVFPFYFNSNALHLLITYFTTLTNIRLSKLFILIFSVYHNIPFGGL